MTGVDTPLGGATRHGHARRERYAALETLRQLSCRKGAKVCMMPAHGSDVLVASSAAGVVKVGGVRRCGSIAACPVCAATARSRRAAEIQAIVDAADERGDRVWFVTATVQHARGDDLRGLMRGVQAAWSGVWSGASPRRLGYVGQIRAWDFTYGESGWHPHIHAVVIFDASADVERAGKWIESRAGAYVRGLERQGLSAAYGPGWHAVRVEDGAAIGEYVADGGLGGAQWGLGCELAIQTAKDSLSPWQILAGIAHGIVVEGSPSLGWLRARWREYEQSTMGTRQIVIGRSLAERYRVEVVDDDDAVLGELDGEAVAELRISGIEWVQLLRSGDAARVIEMVSSIGLEHGAGPPLSLRLCVGETLEMFATPLLSSRGEGSPSSLTRQ